MNQVHVIWPRGRGFWDHGLLEDIFEHRWRPVAAHEFVHHVATYRNPPYASFDVDTDGVVVVLPARHCVDHYDEINAWLARYRWVLLLVTGDEESSFHAERIQHPNMKRWQQLPKPRIHDFADRFIINGYPSPIHDYLPRYDLESAGRPLDWFFSGQITHARRKQCVGALRALPNGVLQETAGFTQGEPHEEYYRHMASAKVIPCPSGAIMPDSFRLAEALEAGCIPVADGKSPHEWYPDGYWQYVFGEQPPFPIVNSWGEILSLSYEWPATANRTFAWWQAYKRKLAYAMRDDINTLRKELPVLASTDQKVTVLIPTSPIPSHPETTIIDEVIASIRRDLPNSEIILMMDGVRPAMEHRRSQYEEYKRRVIWKCNHEWKNVLPLVFDTYTQQADMTRRALDQVKTPFVLFMEHDAVLLTERHIDWDAIVALLASGAANMVRLYWRGEIHPEHLYLMRGTIQVHGATFERTVQYSQWPNVATTEFYRKILAEHFPIGKPEMIETVMYSPVVEYPWDRFRVVIYKPADAAVWVHRNGRQGDPAEW